MQTTLKEDMGVVDIILIILVLNVVLKTFLFLCFEQEFVTGYKVTRNAGDNKSSQHYNIKPPAKNMKKHLRLRMSNMFRP